MSEETENTAETNSEPAAEEQKAPREKLPKPEPPQARKTVIYRLVNGEWDDFADKEEIDMEGFFRFMVSEYREDGSLVSEIQYDDDGEELQKSINEYNDKGKVTKFELYNEGQLAERIVYTYDDKNRVLTETREFEDGFPLITHYSYDSEDRVIEKRVDDSDGELQKRETFEYHPEWKDKVVKHVVYDEEGNASTEQLTTWEEREGKPKVKSLVMTDHSFDSYRRTEFFDPKTREDQISYATFNDKDKVVEYVKTVFDEEGRESQEQSFSVNESDNYIVYYEYDEYDRPIAQEQHQEDRIISKIQRRFNSKGSVALVAMRSFNRGMYVDVFDYEYFE